MGRKRRRGTLTRRKRSKRAKVSAGSKKSYRTAVVALSRRKIAGEADMPFVQNIEQDLTQAVLGGSTANHQLWNTIGQGVLGSERVGERVRRTGLWLGATFFRSDQQVAAQNNHWVRVIFAMQRSHEAPPGLMNGVSATIPAWPNAVDCFTRDWHRYYKLVKDTKVFFAESGTALASTPVLKRRVFKLKFSSPCTWLGAGADMDTGRLYMGISCPDAPPATAADLKVTLDNYCSYFVDELV